MLLFHNFKLFFLFICTKTNRIVYTGVWNFIGITGLIITKFQEIVLEDDSSLMAYLPCCFYTLNYLLSSSASQALLIASQINGLPSTRVSQNCSLHFRNYSSVRSTVKAGVLQIPSPTNMSGMTFS